MSLFIGGLHDGEWHQVDRLPDDRLPTQWSMRKRLPAAYYPGYHMNAPVELITQVDHYQLLEFHVDGHHYKVYRHYKMSPHEAFETLLRGYQRKDTE